MPDQPKGIESPAIESVLDSVRRTVQTIPTSQSMVTPSDSLVIYFASVADTITPWGTSVKLRDKQLRQTFIREPLLAGAVYSIAASHASFRWHIECEDDALRDMIIRMLSAAQLGAGWGDFAARLTIDLVTQDNGAFIEVVREEDRADAPVLGILALEAGRCTRTGNPMQPVQYEDEEGKRHDLKWWNAVPLSEMPSPITTMRGMQYCAITRVLAAAQIMRDILTFRGEKVGGRFQRVLHIVGGPAKSDIARALNMDQENADNQGLTRFMLPTILASLDPSKPVSHVEIPLASLPDNFTLEDEMKWYITTLALAFGRDYQDFAPLPGGNLGTSAQSEMLHQKSKGKGPALFMEMLTYAMNFRGIIPHPPATFTFKELDLQDEGDRMKIRRLRAETRSTMIKSGEITPEIARELAVAEGDYDKELMAKIAASETRQRAAAEERLRLNAELNSRVRGTAGGRMPGTPTLSGPTGRAANIPAIKAAMLSADYRSNLQSIIPLAAIVQTLRTTEQSKGIAPALEAMLAKQAESGAAIQSMLAGLADLAQAIRSMPAPMVSIQAPPAPNVVLPTTPVSVD